MTLASTIMVALTIMIWMMLSSNNPMNLSLIIMMLATLTSMMFGLALSPWSAMIMFLIYVGGMMVMFSYFVSLSSNDAMTLKSKVHFILLPMIMMKTLNLTPHIPKFNSCNTNKLYMSSNSIILVLIILVLLMMMVIVVKMMKSNNSPLRGFHQK